MLVKRPGEGLLEVAGGGAGGIELAHLGGAECLAQPGSLGVDAALAAGFAQQGAELDQGQRGGRGGDRCGGEDAVRNLVTSAFRRAGFANTAHALRYYGRDDQHILSVYGYA